MTTKICGIYIIENTIDKRVYIGQSVDVATRLRDHKKLLLKLCHPNKYLNNFTSKYGIDVLLFHVIEQCHKSKLGECERKWISFYDSKNNGFNCTYGGDDNPMNHAESRKKVSEALKGKKKSKEWSLKQVASRDYVKMHNTLISTGRVKLVYAYNSTTGDLIYECYGYSYMAKHFNVGESNIRQCVGGSMNSVKGVHFSLIKKTNREVLDSMIPKNQTPEYKKKMSIRNMGSGNPNYGKKHPENSGINNPMRKYIAAGGKKKTLFDSNLIIDLYLSGLSQDQVAKIVGCTQVGVGDTLKRNKIKARPQGRHAKIN